MLHRQQTLQDRYQLDRTLGQSAGRQTWLATDLELREPVVVKLLTFSDQVQWDHLRLFEREAAILKQLDHPCIPRYRDYFCLDDRMLWFGLVQDYIPGRSLKELLEQGHSFTVDQVQTVAESLLKILIYLHRLSPPVLHRDLKPSNIILSNDKQIYLVDFGAVQDRAAAAGATFTVVGTYGYAPLEQLGGRATPASDLYALGATLIHLLTGVAPANLPQRDSRIEFIDQVDLNPAFTRWLKRLTEPNLEQRFSSAQQALKVLKGVQTASAIVRSKPSVRPIQVTKSARSLQIKIPLLWTPTCTLKRVGTPLLILFFLTLVWDNIRWWQITNIFPSLLWPSLIILLLGSLFLLPSWVTTEINFDQRHFEIHWKLLGFCLWRQQGDTAAIDRVFAHKLRVYGGSIAAVSLGSGVREQNFVALEPALTDAECDWLAEEISDWLGL